MKIGLLAWGSEGDVAPFTALSAGLAGAGHEVTLAVADNIGRDYSKLGERFGYGVVPIAPPTRLTPAETERAWQEVIELGNPIRQAELILRYGFDPVLEPMLEAAQRLCSNCDAVIGHFMAYPLRAAAELASRPAATLNVVHNCVPSRYRCPPGLPDLGSWSYPLGWRLSRALVNRIFLPRVNALRGRLGLPEDRDVMTETWVGNQLNLLAVSPQICDRPSDWDERHVVCGFLNPPAGLQPPALPPDLDAFLSAGDAPVYFTFGSMMSPGNLGYLRRTLALWQETADRARCRAVFQVPTGELGLGQRSPTTFVTTGVPYSLAFPRCALVVHHGGAGTTQSTLLAGCPSIIVAHMSDQSFWGSELERLGAAGKTQRRNALSARRLAHCIRQALAAPRLRERAALIGRAIAREDGVRRAVDSVQRQLLARA